MLDDLDVHADVLPSVSAARIALPARYPPEDWSTPRLDVLVVEDDPGDYAAIERCLRYCARFESHLVSTGSLTVAHAVLALYDFDVVILDHAVHGGSTLDLISHIRRDKPGCAVVLVTGHLTWDLETEALDLGVAACLSKDELSPRILETILRQSLLGNAMRLSLREHGR
jgi:DNA-binding NarL/FixJ family response regulator